MARYRIGNDFTLVWTINNKGEAFPLEGKNVRLYYTCERGRFEADIRIEDTNKVVWDFFGSQQKVLGGYSLTLVITQSDGKRTITKDVYDAFTLVSKDRETGEGEDDSCNEIIEIYHENVTTDLDLCRINPIIPEIEEDEKGVGYWVIDGVNTGKIATVGVADWNADEGESGYIKNRTHYKEAVERAFVGIEKGDYILDAEGNPDGWESWVEAGGVEDESAKVSLPVTIAFGLESLNFELTFDHVGQREILENEEYEDSYASILEVGIDEKDGECYLHFTTRGCDTPWLIEGREFDVRIESFKQLNDVYIPSTIARKSELEALQNTKIDKQADDYYPQLSVGTADNLSGVDEVDSEFSFRRSGGGAIADGVARVQSIKGNSVVWNQLSEKFYFTEDRAMACREGVSITKGHKYLLLRTQTNGGCYLLPKPDFYDYSLANGVSYKFFTSEIDCVSSGVMPTYPHLYCTAESGYVQIVNLTQMFGAGNEPSTIEEYNARKPFVEDEYAYNEGEVIHMTAEGISSKGVNAWDEEWRNGYIYAGTVYENSATGIISKNHIRVLPDTQYSCTIGSAMSYATISYYDKEKKYIGQETLGNSRTFKTPANCRYILFFVEGMPTYKHDICIGISGDWDGYHAPIEASEDLSIVAKYFLNGMRSAGAAHDEIRYNKQTNKWEKVVRIGEVDMGSLTWAHFVDKAVVQTANLPNLKKDGGLICRKYIQASGEPIYAGRIDGISSNWDYFGITADVIYAHDSAYTDAASFKASLQGVMLYYELANPIVTEIKEKDFNLDYKVWNCGTEQMVASKPSSALSADITYGFNAVGLIKQLRSMLEALSAKVANL